jgi:hypothetical protein
MQRPAVALRQLGEQRLTNFISVADQRHAMRRIEISDEHEVLGRVLWRRVPRRQHVELSCILDDVVDHVVQRFGQRTYATELRTP